MKLELSEIEKSYMAGFFDGEGCITFQVCRRNKDRTTCYSSSIQIVNSNYEILFLLQQRFGGKLYKRKPKKLNHSTCWALIFTNTKSKEYFLNSVIDYLVIKKPQAKIMLDYIRCRKQKVLMRGQHPQIDNSELNMIRSVREINSSNSFKSKDFLTRFPIENRGTL